MTENETMTEESGSGDFPQAYMRLRTVLDGLELTALRYCLKDKDAAKRIARAEELEKLLMPIITKYQNKTREVESQGNTREGNAECPDGLFDCGGCCVGYPCP